jgi:ribonucleotide monophosphatase NagD (HAD superfamily)
VGEPSGAFFELALAELGLPAGAVLMVGDDVDMDVAGGAEAGCRTVLVRTGREKLSPSSPEPDLVLDSIAQLPAQLGLGER